MNRYRQLILNGRPMPEIGEIKELINRNREVVGIGIVYGVLPGERTALIQPLNLDENGNVVRLGVNNGMD